MRRWYVLVALAGTLFAAPAAEQSFELSVASIMRGPELVGEPPQCTAVPVMMARKGTFPWI
jgi:hypothetical protein